jgi:YfiH family protein
MSSNSVRSGPMQLLTPQWPALPAGVRALTTLRGGGASLAPYDDGVGGGGLNLGLHVGDREADVFANRRQLRTILPSEPVWLRQVHGTDVVNAANASIGSGAPFGAGAEPGPGMAEAPQADASIAPNAGAVCAVMTADCLPVLFCDQAGRIVGAAHAGWRGLLNGVLESTVAAMRVAGADHISAWLGPAIGPQRFEVGAEVRSAYLARDTRYAPAFAPIGGVAGNLAGNASEKYMADIYKLARLTLVKVGVDQVFGGDLCTVSDPLRFYSYRRDGFTGRFVSLIWIE